MTVFQKQSVSLRYYVRTGVSDYPGFEGTESLQTTTSHTVDGFVIKGSNLGNWRWRIRNHTTATTDLSGYEQRSDGAQGNEFYGYRKIVSNSNPKSYAVSAIRGDVGVQIPAPDDPSGLSVTSANNQALGKLLGQIQNAQSAVQGGVVIGELAKTIKMIREPAQSFRRGLDDYLKALRKRSRGKFTPFATSKLLSDTWLEYSFGWLPLLSDVNGALKSVYRIVAYDSPFKGVSASATVSTRTNPETGWDLNFGAISYKRILTKGTDVTVRYHGEVGARTESGLYTIPQQLGLSFGNFLPTVWELIPYSFLVDYFTNIGAILNVFSLMDTRICWMEKGTVKESWVTLTPRSLTIQPVPVGQSLVGYVNNPGSTPYTLRRRRVLRENYLGSFTPGLEFKIPGTSTKWINLGALFTSAQGLQRLLRKS